jgi:hypothetical protein
VDADAWGSPDSGLEASGGRHMVVATGSQSACRNDDDAHELVSK